MTDLKVLALEKRLQVIEDREAIIRLKATYCNAVDGGWDRASHNGDAVASLFTPDGIWSAGAVGEAQGSAPIKTLIDGYFKLHFAFHCVMNPNISVIGDGAEAEWHFIVLLTHEDEGPLLAGGIYRDRFVRFDESWRFSKLQADLLFFQPAEHGWDDIFRQKFHPRTEWRDE